MITPVLYGNHLNVTIRLIKGIVTEENVPVESNIIVLNRDTGQKIGTTRSDKNGKYSLLVPEARLYSVIAFNAQKTFNAAIQDLVVPK